MFQNALLYCTKVGEPASITEDLGKCQGAVKCFTFDAHSFFRRLSASPQSVPAQVRILLTNCVIDFGGLLNLLIMLMQIDWLHLGLHFHGWNWHNPNKNKHHYTRSRMANHRKQFCQECTSSYTIFSMVPEYWDLNWAVSWIWYRPRAVSWISWISLSPILDQV